MRKANAFYLTLPSNSSMKYFPSNTLTNYTTKLQNRVELDTNKWEMALVEVHYPYSILNITRFNNYIQYKSMDDVKWNELRISEGYYASINSIVAEINKYSETLNFSLRNHPAYKHVTVDISTKQRNINVRLSPQLARILGFKPTDDLSEVKIGRSPPNVVREIPSQMYIYTDIAESHMVGDAVAPLLRIININPMEHTFGSDGVQIFDSPHYIPVQKHNFEQIEIDLRDSTGAHIPFSFGLVCLKLHFRRCGEKL